MERHDELNHFDNQQAPFDKTIISCRSPGRILRTSFVRKQADEQTIQSQIAAIRERITADGLTFNEEHGFIDDGETGATMMRPSLERLRDAAYAGGVQRLYVHSPDRLARKYAYQVLLVDELRQYGTEIVFLNRAIGVSPEEDLFLGGSSK